VENNKTIKQDISQISLALNKINCIIESNETVGDSLLSGNLGLVLYYMYSYKCIGEVSYLEKGRYLLENIFSNIQAGEKGAIQRKSSLSNGLVGLGNVLILLQEEELLDFETESILSQIDELVFSQSVEQINNGNLDYLSGAIGGMYYLAQRIPNQQAVEYIEKLLTVLLATAIESSNGKYFINQSINQKNNTPDSINIGLAHGLCGILTVLLEIYTRNVETQSLKKIITEGINYLLFYKNEVDFQKEQFAYFPNSIQYDLPKYNSFIGWCYGDLNVLQLLLKASKIFCRIDWLKKANEISKVVVHRKIDYGTMIKDPFFCHGTCSMAQMYLRLYQISGEVVLKEAYDYWINQTIEYLDNKREYQILSPQMTNGLLYGYAGVGLVLLSSIYNKNLSWDRVFLL
jgi:lantibiotic biosynthesis protein